MLKFTLGYTGCNFDPTSINLVWDGSIIKTNPAQARLALNNLPPAQLCNASFQKVACFNINALKMYGKTIRLSIEGCPGGSVLVNFP
ncbi:MAG: hypothetical protein SGJ00_15105 [bacterium]|nr:hypothetical protein [bacterium]